MSGSPKKNIIVLVVCLCFGVIIVVGGIIVPIILSIHDIESHISTTAHSLERDYLKAQHIHRSTRDLERILENTTAFTQATIRPNGELQVITELEQLAATSHIEQTLHVVYVDPKKNDDSSAQKKSNIPLPMYTFSFLTRGTFADLVQYLSALEKLPYYLTIDSLQFEHPATTVGDIVTLRFDARVYIKKF